MASATYDHLIAQNVAPEGAVHIGVYDSNGKRVGGAGLQGLALPTTQQKLYSFLCVSDVHLSGGAEHPSKVDFERALIYANNDADIKFTTLCGDVIQQDNVDGYQYKEFTRLNTKYGTGKPVYAISGNHESIQRQGTQGTTYVDESQLWRYRPQNTTGTDLYYSFTYGDDVFIMLGTYGWSLSYPLFKRVGSEEAELKFLQETLEANLNRRCFVFFHVFNSADWVPTGDGQYAYSEEKIDSGEPYPNFYGGDLLNYGSDSVEQRKSFLDILKHYKNAIWFHGHSHAEFELQEVAKTAIYSEQCGYRSVHIPSLYEPKKMQEYGQAGVGDTEGSQGYIVDVYPDGIHLRGRDFARGEFVGIASYWIDTTLQTVEAGTYSDPSGLI